MRTLGFRSNVLIVVAAAVGLLGALGLPWYAPAPAPQPGGDDIGNLDGPLQALFTGIVRDLGEHTGTRGWDALGTWGTALAGGGLLCAVLAAACTSPALQPLVRDTLRYISLAVAAVALWKLIDSPGPNDVLELRYGAVIGAGSAVVLASCAQAVANAPLRRRVPPPVYTPVAPPVTAWGDGSSAPPPGV